MRKLSAIFGLLACVLVGCSTPPVVVRPKPRAAADTTRMAVTDARRIQIHPRTVPVPSPESVVGEMLSQTFVLPDGKKAADLVASVVAVRFPSASVSLKEFSAKFTPGVWSNDIAVTIVADVAAIPGQWVSVSGRGKNAWVNPSPRNWEIGIERALEDFAANLAKLPSAESPKTP